MHFLEGFDRFRKAMIDMEYQQINVDHTMLFRQQGGHTTKLAVYVDDMIITCDDEREIAQLKARLGNKFLGKGSRLASILSWD